MSPRRQPAQGLERFQSAIHRCPVPTKVGKLHLNPPVSAQHVDIIRRIPVGNGQVFRRLVEAPELTQEVGKPDPQKGRLRIHGHGALEELQCLVGPAGLTGQHAGGREQERAAVGDRFGGLLADRAGCPEADQHKRRHGDSATPHPWSRRRRVESWGVHAAAKASSRVQGRVKPLREGTVRARMTDPRPIARRCSAFCPQPAPATRPPALRRRSI